VDIGYDPNYGARPLRRTIQREVETPLAYKIVSGEVREGDCVVVDFEDGRLVFRVKEMEAEAAEAAS